MPKIKILKQNDKIEWTEILNRMIGYDFYHTYSYNFYYKLSGSEPVLYCFEYNNVEIVFPFIIRDIKDSEYKDITSSYGYVGPIASVKKVDDDVLKLFHNSLHNFFIENKIIAAFSRMHPSLDNSFLLEGLGNIISLSQTVYMDLSLDIDKQRHQYRKSVKSSINKLKREGYIIIEDRDKQHIDDFIEIYNENMDRVAAKKEYYFDKRYYEMIFNSDDIGSHLYFIEKDGERVATSIFVYTGDIIQYHLSATRGDYLRESPIRLLLDYIRINGTEKGYNELHLGGGLGSKEDSLFSFKAGFSDCRYTFKIWKYISNEEVYDQLVKERGVTEDTGFFPLYRN